MPCVCTVSSLGGRPTLPRASAARQPGPGSPEPDDADPGRRAEDGAIFFRLSSIELGLLFFGVLLGSTAVGVLLGRRVRHLSDSLKEPFGILQGALLGVVGLLLAFGLSLAVSRYENRRADVVDEANAIGTTYLRAQTLHEPARSESLNLLVRYTENAVRLSEDVPLSAAARATAAAQGEQQRRLWALAATELDARPRDSAPRLYVETLNDTIDAQGVRLAGLANRVPTAVLLLDLLGSAVALGLLAAYLAIVGRGVVAVTLGAVLVAFLLLVTADLDRPTRGMIQVPDTALTNELASMRSPPAAPAP